MTLTMQRDYSPLLSNLRAQGDRSDRMMQAVDALWNHLRTQRLSWAGFYLDSGLREPGHELVLGPRRDKPACSPIGLHGACGRSFVSRRPLVITDVSRLGAGYIACDPLDRSEVVLPMLDEQGHAWGVLDLDSHDTGAFGEHDVHELQRFVEVAGLSEPRDWHGRVDVV